MVILIGGVVLLTHKKPDPATTPADAASSKRPSRATSRVNSDPRDLESGAGEQEVLWALGDASDDEDDGKTPRPSTQLQRRGSNASGHTKKTQYGAVRRASGEGQRLMDDVEDEDNDLRSAALVDVPLTAR